MKGSSFDTMVRYYGTCLEGVEDYILGRGYTADTLPAAVMEKSIRQHIAYLVNKPGFTYIGRVLQDIAVSIEPNQVKCPTAQIDCISWVMQVGEEFYRELMRSGTTTVHPSFDSLCTTLCHEAMHIIEETQFREKSIENVNHRSWNIATDLHINYQLFKYGMVKIPLKGICWPLPNGLFDIPIKVTQVDVKNNQRIARQYILRINVDGMSTEDIYHRMTRFYREDQYSAEEIKANEEEWGVRRDSRFSVSDRLIQKGDAIVIADPADNMIKTYGQVVRVDGDNIQWNDITQDEADSIYELVTAKRLGKFKRKVSKAEDKILKRDNEEPDAEMTVSGDQVKENQ